MSILDAGRMLVPRISKVAHTRVDESIDLIIAFLVDFPFFLNSMVVFQLFLAGFPCQLYFDPLMMDERRSGLHFVSSQLMLQRLFLDRTTFLIIHFVDHIMLHSMRLHFLNLFPI